MLKILFCLILGGLAVGGGARAGAAEKTGSVSFVVYEGDSNRVMPARIHLTDATGKTHVAPGLPAWKDHFCMEGEVTLELPPGTYTYVVERGPEYGRDEGLIGVEVACIRVVEVRLRRIVDMAAAGYWSGDMHVHRAVKDMSLLMRSEDLHIAPLLTWWNARSLWAEQALPKDPLVKVDENSFYRLLGGEDERDGGALLFYNLDKPFDITWAERFYPCMIRFAEEAREQKNAWVDMEKPFWWDTPLALAHGVVDSMGIANNHMCRSTMLDNEAWGRARDLPLFPSPHGCGEWSQHIYYQALNAGFRIPPSAGSASGVLPNPVGYNRVYVQLEGPLTWDVWWEGLRAGRCFVTNGPLLQVKAAGQYPGHVFTSDAAVDIDINADIVSNDTIARMEIIKNGMVDQALDPEARTTTIRFDQSGWFLVRVTCDVEDTFRFASTAPYYVEIGAKKKTINGPSVQFFLDWVNERTAQIKLDDPSKRQEVMAYHEQARTFWETRLQEANADVPIATTP